MEGDILTRHASIVPSETVALSDGHSAGLEKKQYLRHAEVRRNQENGGLDTRGVIMGTEWQLTAWPKLSVITFYFSVFLVLVVNRKHALNKTSAQVVSGAGGVVVVVKVQREAPGFFALSETLDFYLYEQESAARRQEEEDSGGGQRRRTAE
ncbi:hypothetical protein PAMA_013961 [Pampus argenteus]